MNAKRHRSLLQSLNATARKVYDAIPQEAEWDLKQIAQELHRLGLGIEFRSIEGACRYMREQGLVTEPRPSFFKRVSVREPREDVMDAKVYAMPPARAVAAPEPSADPVARLTTLAGMVKRIHGTVERQHQAISAELTALAAEIDDAALHVMEQLESSSKQADFGKRLKNLLKEIEG